MTDLTITVSGTGSKRVVALEGALDLATVPDLRQRLQGLGPPDVTKLVVDVGDLAFCDSTGLGTILGALRRMREGGGEFAIARAGGTVLRLLEVTGLDSVVPLESA